MSIFGMGPGEIFLILVVALVVFGPDRLPDVMRQVGKTVREFRRVTSSLTAEFHAVTAELTDEFSELKAVTQELQAELREIQNEVASVQQDVAGELNQAQQALRFDGSEVSAGNSTSSTPAYGIAGVAPASGSEATSMIDSSGNGASNPPRVATREDPTADVSWLDADELVVMARTSRLVNAPALANGHMNGNGNGHAVTTLDRPQRVIREGRRATITYRRPRLSRN